MNTSPAGGKGSLPGAHLIYTTNTPQGVARVLASLRTMGLSRPRLDTEPAAGLNANSAAAPQVNVSLANESSPQPNHGAPDSRSATYDEQPKSRLLRLPQEIRDIILAHALVQEEAIYTNRLRKAWGDNCETADAYIALSITCRQLRAETHTMFWKHNCFTFYIAQKLPPIPANALKLISRFELYRWRDGAEAVLMCWVEWGSHRTDVRCPGLLSPFDVHQYMCAYLDLLRASGPATRLLLEGMRGGRGLSMDVLRWASEELRRNWGVVKT